jgi:hypothetical protein
MRRPPVLSAIAWGSPMSAIYPPENQQSPSQPSPEVRPPKRHRVRKTLLIVGGAFAALILVIVVVSLATSNSIKPTTRPGTAAPAAPDAQSYPNVQSLLAAMAAHGATCSNADIKTGSTVNGALSTFAECTGVSSGDTAIVMFTDHAGAVAYANNTLSLSQNASLGPTAEVVGPNWAVNTVPTFAPKVVSAVGGQLITAPTASSTPTPTPTPTSSVAQFGQGNGFTYSDGTQVSVASATPATLSQEAAGGNPGDPAVLISVRVTAGSTSLDASQIQVSVNAGPDGSQLSQAFDTQVNTPSGTLAPGEHGTYVFEFDLQHSSWGSALNVTVTPGFNYNAASFTGAAS